MKKYILEVNEKDEGHIEVFEVNIDSIISSLSVNDARSILQSLDNGKEIILSKTNSKRLAEYIEIGNKLS